MSVGNGHSCYHLDYDTKPFPHFDSEIRLRSRGRARHARLYAEV